MKAVMDYRDLNNSETLRNSHPDQLQEAVKDEPYFAAVRLHNMAIELYNLRMSLAAQSRKVSNNREWWKTYRAALSGAMARGGVTIRESVTGMPNGQKLVGLSVAEARTLATEAANTIHGPLQEIEEVPYP